MTTQTQIRMSKPLRDKIQKHREKMATDRPGERVTFSDAVRSLLEQALAGKRRSSTG